MRRNRAASPRAGFSPRRSITAAHTRKVTPWPSTVAAAAPAMPQGITHTKSQSSTMLEAKPAIMAAMAATEHPMLRRKGTSPVPSTWNTAPRVTQVRYSRASSSTSPRAPKRRSTPTPKSR